MQCGRWGAGGRGMLVPPLPPPTLPPARWQVPEAVVGPEGRWIRRRKQFSPPILFLAQSPSPPSFCLACPVESKLAPIPTRAIALFKKELLAVLELALQVAAAPSLEKVEACVAVCDRARKLCA